MKIWARIAHAFKEETMPLILGWFAVSICLCLSGCETSPENYPTDRYYPSSTRPTSYSDARYSEPKPSTEIAETDPIPQLQSSDDEKVNDLIEETQRVSAKIAQIDEHIKELQQQDNEYSSRSHEQNLSIKQLEQQRSNLSEDINRIEDAIEKRREYLYQRQNTLN